MGSQFKQTVDVKELRRNYFLYVLRHRAIPAITDGLKPSGRRPLWIARNGKKTKVATLAGATMELHPHDECSDAINNLTGPYKNNIPLFHGDGAFGTLLEPSEFGKPRYTSVTISNFAAEVVLADLDIVPMVDNYDNTVKEPAHFLPLIPMCLVNPTLGIAGGYRSSILPRDPVDVIEAQIQYLSSGTIDSKLVPYFAPTNDTSIHSEQSSTGVSTTHYFMGTVEVINSTTVGITKLPYGMTHDHIINRLEELLADKTIVDYVDQSKNIIDIKIKFKRDVLENLQEGDLIELFSLVQKHHEILNLLTIDGQTVQTLTPHEVISQFTDWRLQWYIKRYQAAMQKIDSQVQLQRDIIIAIDSKANEQASKLKNRTLLQQFLSTAGVVNVEYVSQLPIHRFTPEEADKLRSKLAELELEQQKLQNLIDNESERKKAYIADLRQIRRTLKNNGYDHE